MIFSPVIGGLAAALVATLDAALESLCSDQLLSVLLVLIALDLRPDPEARDQILHLSRDQVSLVLIGCDP